MVSHARWSLAPFDSQLSGVRSVARCRLLACARPHSNLLAVQIYINGHSGEIKIGDLGLASLLPKRFPEGDGPLIGSLDCPCYLVCLIPDIRMESSGIRPAPLRGLRQLVFCNVHMPVLDKV